MEHLMGHDPIHDFQRNIGMVQGPTDGNYIMSGLPAPQNPSAGLLGPPEADGFNLVPKIEMVHLIKQRFKIPALPFRGMMRTLPRVL